MRELMGNESRYVKRAKLLATEPRKTWQATVTYRTQFAIAWKLLDGSPANPCASRGPFKLGLLCVSIAQVSNQTPLHT